jgi:hypothetical protein
VGGRFEGGYLGLQFGVRREEVLELLALVFGQGAESVDLLEVIEAVATGYTAHPGTSIPRESKCPRIFCSPSLMRPFTVPSGRSRSSAISLWVYPEKYASPRT